MRCLFMYIKGYWKKADITKFVSFLFLVPMCTVIFYNVTKSFLNLYNYSRFINNAQYHYIIRTDKTDYDFYNLSAALMGNYSEEQSIAEVKYYKNSASSSIFFCSDISVFEESYFCQENFIGDFDLSNYDYGKGFPILISYDLQHQLDSGIGDAVYLDYDYYDINAAESKTYSMMFTVAGILRPFYDVNNISATRDDIDSHYISCVITDDETIMHLAELDNASGFLKFSNSINENEDYISKNDQINSMKQYTRSNRFLFNALYGGVSSIIVLTLVVVLELNFILKRNKKEINILRLLGMKKTKLKLLLFMILMSKFLLSLMLALFIVKFIIYNHVLYLFCDIIFISVTGCVFLIVITITIFLRVMIHRI